MKISVKIHDPAKTARRIFSDDVKVYTNTRLHAYCSDYVPMDTGILDSTVEITKDYVHYKSPYAHFQWEGKVFVDDRGSTYAKRGASKHAIDRDLQYSIDQNPLATSHWEQAAMRTKGDQLAADIEDYIKRK